MVKPKHTPGPWFIGDLQKEDKVLRLPIRKRITPDDPRSAYCVAWIVNLHGELGSEQANARLIAQAPDLLFALKSLADLGHLDSLPFYLQDLVFRALNRAQGYDTEDESQATAMINRRNDK